MQTAPRGKHQFTLRQLLIALTAIAVVLGAASPWLRRIDPEFVPLVGSAAFWLVAVGLIVGLGLLPLRAADTTAAVKLEALAHGIAALGAVVFAMVCVPTFEKVFRDLEMSLAYPAQLVLQVTEAARKRFFLGLPCAIALVALDVGAFRALHSYSTTRWLAKGWSAAMTISVLSVLLFAAWAISREFFAMYVNLSKTEYLF